MRARILNQHTLRAALALALSCSLLAAVPALAGSELQSLPTAEGGWSIPDSSAGRAPSAQGAIELRGRGMMAFDPSEITTVRPDAFRPGHFSVFDVLVHLAASGAIDLEYSFDVELQTHVIKSLNGLEGWWYDAHYEGGSFDRTVVRMDLFPVKDGMSIVLYLEDPVRLAAIEEHFRDEIRRLTANEGQIVIPRVTLRSATSEIVFDNVDVTTHDVRADVFHDGFTTMLDVLLSLGEQGAFDTLDIEWRIADGDISVIDGYYVVRVSSGGFSPEATGACVLTHQIGGELIDDHLAPHTHTMSHVHLTADLEILISPESVEWLWVCL